MAEHALLSPSSAYRWLQCPGSVAAEAQVTRKDSGPAAEFGTACHELGEWALRSQNKTCATFVGKTTRNGYVITPDMADLIQDYVDRIGEYAHGHTLLIEQRVNFSSYIGVPDSFGTSDAIIITADGKELQIHDLKTGYNIVEAEDNPQLKLYALGALYEFGMLGQFERVRMVIHQPSHNAVKEWDCSVEDLLTFGETAKIQAQKAVSLLLPADGVSGYEWSQRILECLSPDEDACRYCRAAATCPALNAKVIETIGVGFEDLTKSDIPALIPQIPDRLSVKMNATGLVEDWIKNIRAEVERQLLNGAAIPGYKIVRGKQGNRKWSDEKEATEMLKTLKLPKAQMYHMSLISPTDAEKVLKVAPEKWEKLAPFIVRAEGGLSVAPESDKRPAVMMTPVKEEFEDLTGESLI